MIRFFAVLLLASLTVVRADDDRISRGQRVVVTGHSFHMPLAPFVEQIVKAANITGHQWIVRQGIGGSRVSQHWDLPDDRNKAKAALRAGGVDVMTMSPNSVVPDDAIEKFVQLGLEKNPGLRVLVQVSWYPCDGLKPPHKVAKNEDRDAKTVADLRAVYDPFREVMRQQVREINARHSRPVAFLVPVGEAVLRLREKVIAGKVPGVARQSELFGDQIGHAKTPVLQLAAYCQFACLYRRSPVGLACFEKPGDETTRQRNQLLQKIAWETVLDEPFAGVAANRR
jgi:hypothetical protein